jgi:hypothetical protein
MLANTAMANNDANAAAGIDRRFERDSRAATHFRESTFLVILAFPFL